MAEHFSLDRKDPGDEFSEWLLIAAVSKNEQGDLAVPVLPGGGLDVVLTVNGVELPVRPALERLEEEFDRMVNRRAFNLVKEKCAGLVDLVVDIEKQIKQRAAENLNLPDAATADW